jgi:hypothetical protein
VALQIGLSPEQSVLVTQPVHVLVAGLQIDWVPGQSVSAWHTTHWPLRMPVVAHTGSPLKLAQSVLPWHARQVVVERLQMGELPAQLELASQPTHVPVCESHTGEPATHDAMLVAEHWVHWPARAPLVWHAGVGAAQSVSAAQALHACVAALHTGVAPEQFALLSHWTHTLVVASPRQSEPAALPAQSAFVAHITHWPRNAPDVAQTG